MRRLAPSKTSDRGTLCRRMESGRSLEIKYPGDRERDSIIGSWVSWFGGAFLSSLEPCFAGCFHYNRSQPMKTFTGALRIFVATSFALLGSTTFASAQVQQEWAARYNDAYNGRDGAYCMAVDKAGNIYICG